MSQASVLDTLIEIDNKLGGSLTPVSFDAINITSVNGNGDPLTVLYYSGGLAGTLVATLTITYDGGDNLQTVVRT